eukprot:TRINITY_DN13238_c0_g1_i1.p1 TRINITY_DN13238_c0_g1~~TRINITY_DN13238_c0_g1_i1.p1  ORF type:complete len:527 (+),score=82.49 TRINITY_DN13238_c0_g1_i1:42-1622(+)
MDGDWVGRLLLPALAAAAEPGRPGTPATVQCLRRRRPVLNGLIRGLQSTSKTRTLSAATSSASHLLQVAWCAAVKTLSADPFQLESVVDAWRAVLSAGEHAVLSCNTPLDTVGLYSMLCFVAWIVATSAGTAPADGAMGVRTVLGAMQTDLVLWRELRLLFQQPVRLLAEERAMLDRLLKLEQTLFGTHGVDEDMSTAFSKLLGDQLPAVSAPARSALQAAHCEKPGLRGVGGSAVALWGDSFVLGGFGEVFVVDVDAGTTHSVSVHGPDDWPVHRGSAVVTVECSDDTMFVFQRSRRLTEWALTRRTGCPTATLTHVYAAGGRDDELSTHSRCRHIAVDSSSSTLFSIHERHAVAEWDLESQRCRSMLRTVHPALCLCVVKQLLVVWRAETRCLLPAASGRKVWFRSSTSRPGCWCARCGGRGAGASGLCDTATARWSPSRAIESTCGTASWRRRLGRLGTGSCYALSLTSRGWSPSCARCARTLRPSVWSTRRRGAGNPQSGARSQRTAASGRVSWSTFSRRTL